MPVCRGLHFIRHSSSDRSLSEDVHDQSQTNDRFERSGFHRLWSNVQKSIFSPLVGYLRDISMIDSPVLENSICRSVSFIHCSLPTSCSQWRDMVFTIEREPSEYPEHLRVSWSWSLGSSNRHLSFQYAVGLVSIENLFERTSNERPSRRDNQSSFTNGYVWFARCLFLCVQW